MCFLSLRLTRQIASGICVWLFLTAACAQPSTNNSPSATVLLESNIVEKAMALVRQRKFTEAREVLLLAAESGQPEPQALLGQMYNAGWGVPVDFEQAFKWWSRAADGGSTDAQWGLGLLYDEGNGVPQDSKKAVSFWKKAAERGNIKATVHLAFAYEEGRGVARDLKACANYFKIAAEAGEPAAQQNYGLKLLHGEGVSQDKVSGCAWLAVAAESPRAKGTKYAERIIVQRDKYRSELSPKERENADRLKKEFEARIKAD